VVSEGQGFLTEREGALNYFSGLRNTIKEAVCRMGVKMNEI